MVGKWGVVREMPIDPIQLLAHQPHTHQRQYHATTAQLHPASATQPHQSTCLSHGGLILFFSTELTALLCCMLGFWLIWCHLNSEGPSPFESSGAAQLARSPCKDNVLGVGVRGEQALEKKNGLGPLELK